MYAAKIIGTAVCTVKDAKMTGLKLLVVQPISLLTLENEGKPVVAVDVVGAGEDEVVLVVAGSSARQTDLTQNLPVDAASSTLSTLKVRKYSKRSRTREGTPDPGKVR